MIADQNNAESLYFLFKFMKPKKGEWMILLALINYSLQNLAAAY